MADTLYELWKCASILHNPMAQEPYNIMDASLLSSLCSLPLASKEVLDF